MEENFYTTKSQTVFYKGNTFDSLLEFQFALMIEETHAWLRDGLEMYYRLKRVSNGIKTRLPCYRPDLLVRNWSTGIAELVEIKPDGYYDDTLQKREKISARFVKMFKYDWTYRYVTASAIKLSDEQRHKYHRVLSTQNDWCHKPCLHLLQNNSSLTDSQYQQYVLTGLLPSPAH